MPQLEPLLLAKTLSSYITTLLLPDCLHGLKDRLLDFQDRFPFYFVLLFVSFLLYFV